MENNDELNLLLEQVLQQNAAIMQQNAELMEQNRQLGGTINDLKDELYSMRSLINNLSEEMYILRGVIQQQGGDR